MKVISVRVGESPRVMELSNKLSAMQDFVGGLIEMIPFEDDAVLICNEEGKLNSLPANKALCDSKGRILDVICGDFFICRAPYDSEDFDSLTAEMIEKLLHRF